MQELQNQDSNYLQKIIKQNEEILNLLKERWYCGIFSNR
jgi:chorismate mutase